MLPIAQPLTTQPRLKPKDETTGVFMKDSLRAEDKRKPQLNMTEGEPPVWKGVGKSLRKQDGSGDICAALSS